MLIPNQVVIWQESRTSYPLYPCKPGIILQWDKKFMWMVDGSTFQKILNLFKKYLCSTLLVLVTPIQS